MNKEKEQFYRRDLQKKLEVKNTNFVRLVGILLLIFSLAVGIFGFVFSFKGEISFSNFIKEFYANVSAEFMSIAITILIIDYLNERRETQHLKGRLIRELGSEDNGFALRALVELRAYGWINDGSLNNSFLRRANLYRANFHGSILINAFLHKANLNLAYFGEADLQNTNFSEANLDNTTFENCNLKGADFTNAILKSTKFIHCNLLNAKISDDQLTLVSSLEGSILPSGIEFEKNDEEKIE